MANSERQMDYTEIYTASDTLDGSAIFHTIYDVVGFVLYMHQQIPSTVQDMSFEFDAMHSEYKEMEEMALGSEMKPSLRRRHVSKMREIKVGIKRFDKFMNSVLNMQTAIKIMITEVPTIHGVVLALGATPLRPLHIYVLNFSHAFGVSKVTDDFARSKAAETLSRKAIRTLISKGAGSVTYPGPIKLFVLIKAPSSFNQPMHFLPKRDFRYNRKREPCAVFVSGALLKHIISLFGKEDSKCYLYFSLPEFKYGTHSVSSYTVVPLRLLFKSRNQDQEVATTTSEDLIWFQCRHVVKGLAVNTMPKE